MARAVSSLLLFNAVFGERLASRATNHRGNDRIGSSRSGPNFDLRKLPPDNLDYSEGGKPF